MALATRPFQANHAPFLDAHDDPLAQALQPPPDESPEARAAREYEAREASRISHEIDVDIQESRKAFERRKKAIKILLLGQAESGKSTTLKNFQLAFSPQHFRSEKLAWRTIIQLNLIRSIKQLLDVLQEEWAGIQKTTSPTPAGILSSSSSKGNGAHSSPSATPPPVPPLPQQMPLSAKARGKLPAHIAAGLSASSIGPSPPASAPPIPGHNSSHSISINAPIPVRPASSLAATRSVRFSSSPLTDNHKRIRMRLLPLLAIEEELTKKLFPELSLAMTHGPKEGDNVAPGFREVCVRAGSGWKNVLNTIISQQQQQNGYLDGKGRGAAYQGMNGNGTSKIDDPTTVLAACKEDIVTLWEDQVVRGILKKRGVRLQDMPGFFLNDAARIATLDYEPTDDDIVRARLRTLGVEEHRFTMESGAYPGSEWYIYDVGGSKSNRPHWIPYFDDVQAIIFLAPLAFNLMLEEDPKVNRLEDSISLWREICSNPLLSKTTLILFLNKMDILQATLAAGIRVQKYVPSYGDQPNDVQHVVKYFRDKFRGYHKRLSPKTRPFYWHETSVIDTRATAVILVGVREGILRAHLQSVNVI
ncbi:P-loop containing nucleoside triphosphate hydrolase [Abortiporus biennis]